MKRSTYLIKNVGILTLSNFASKILVFLLVPLYTSILSTEDYGTYDLATTTEMMLYPILSLNIVDAVMRFLMDRQVDRRKIITIGNKFILISIVAFGILFFGVNIFVSFDSIAGLEVLIFFYYLSYILNQYFVQVSKGIERVYDMGIAGIIGTVSLLGFNILFLTVFKWGLRGFFLSNILSLVIPDLYYFIRIKFWNFIIFQGVDKKIQKEMLVYGVPLIATTLGWYINSSADKYSVTFLCGVAANGLLSVAYKIPQIIATLQTIFTQAWQISAVKEYGEKDTSAFYGQAFNIINLLMCAACAWLIIFTKPLGMILYQKDFYSAWQYVPFLIISCVFNSASGFLGPILSAKKDSKSMAMSAIYGASANVVMNVAFVYFVGIQGATIATVISSFIIYWIRKKAVGDEIKIEGYEIVLITWVLLCVQAVLEIYTSLWWIELVIMAVMFFFNWKVIKDLFLMGKAMIKRK